MSGARRAGLIASAAFAVTAAAAVLLAVVSRQAWPPALASVLIMVPGLYLAWKAVPEAAAGRVRGRQAAGWEPVELGVHQVAGGGPMPSYIRRPHDELLAALLDPAVPGSRLVVVRGSSSTGKTRAAYEAVTGCLGRWRLEYPLDAAALSARLDAGIPVRTVLWLGELRQYTSGQDGGAVVLGALADLLARQDRVIAVTTMWPEHWDGYIDAARPSVAASAAGAAGQLLARLPNLTGQDPATINPTRGGVVDVPAAFTSAQLTAAALARDPVLAEAADAAADAGHCGQLAQYVAGVPDLLNRYGGPGGDRYGQAVITAAMDAARLGCENPLPAALLLDAAPGYLEGPARTRDIAVWAGPALDWATEELRGAVRAVQPVPPERGTGIIGYRPADYLEQHGRRTRWEQQEPVALWEALAAHTASPADLTRVGHWAHVRRLYRHAAVLWTKAAAMGSADAARDLIRVLGEASPDSVARAAPWAAAHVGLADSWQVAHLLKELRQDGQDNAVTALLARDPAAHASLDNPWGVAMLLEELREAGEHLAVTALAARAAAYASLDDPSGVGKLIREFRQDGQDNAIAALLARDPAGHASLDVPRRVAYLLEELWEAGEHQAVTALAVRAADNASLDNPGDTAELLKALRKTGEHDAATKVLARNPAAHAKLENSDDMALLLEALFEVGEHDAVATFAVRAADPDLDHAEDVDMLLKALHEVGEHDAAATFAVWLGNTDTDYPQPLAWMLEALGEAGEYDAVAILAARAARAELDDPRTVAMLLTALRAVGEDGACAALLARNPAAHARLDDPGEVAELLEALHDAGEHDAATILITRAWKAGIPQACLERLPDGSTSPWPGRELDHTPAQSWIWQEQAVLVAELYSLSRSFRSLHTMAIIVG
jgi:hypothetical protein